MTDVQKWSLKGQWFDVCRCAIPCPCSWAQPPDDDFCEGILLWHIQEGHYGNVKLDGLNVAMLGSFRGNVWDKASDFKDAIFMDERADEPQRAALQSVFSGQAGGWPKRFGEMVTGQHMGFAFASIKVEIAADLSKWSAEIPAHNVVAAAEALMGPTSEGKVTKIYNLPGAETGPGGVATWGRTTAGAPTRSVSSGIAPASPASSSPLSGEGRIEAGTSLQGMAALLSDHCHAA
jgi:hypothetical protein